MSADSDSIRHVAIVGGGFSGTMLAARLAEAGVASTLIERTGDFGLGVAYSTGFDGHLLNVRANRMSAVEGRPDDFVRWLEAHHPDHADAEGFAPRRLYGLYVRDRLAAVEAAHPGLITRITGEAVAINGAAVRLSDGRMVEADAVVLATGNPAPRTTTSDQADSRTLPDPILPDPWAHGALERVGADDDVIIIGTGLTMADVILSLTGRGWRGKATALSRRGLSPRAHPAHHDTPEPPNSMLKLGPLSRRLAEARRLSASAGWRSVMEGLRPVTAELWAAADAPMRARFLRHLRPWWDVHRHRIAGSVAEQLEVLTREGRLRLVAGRVLAAQADGPGVRLDWQPRGAAQDASLRANWLIDCTGPGHDPAHDPATARLIAEGRARIDATGLGLDVDGSGQVLAADDEADDRLLVLGPPARAALWETTAVPDIRKQIEIMARTLAQPASGEA